ncbi:MAG: CRISPR-associated endonuclease Cas2 [Rhodobacteraceae bacterium]|nr:CRISPR-associated endonuclease Cas2 [Paracoccaceae bacterium]
MLVLISYDVATISGDGTKRLRRVARICEDHGQRVQYSVFECEIDPARWTAMRARLIDLIDPEKDSLRFYFLGREWRRRVEHVGAKPSEDPDSLLIV